MKRIFLLTALIITVCITALGNPVVSQGQSNTELGDYKITALDDHIMLNGKELEKFLITYANSDLKVVVAVDKQKKCRKYYVLNDQVPVQYECNGIYFGVKKLDKNLGKIGFTTSLDKLNKSEYYHQRVLTSEITPMLDQLNLIASYYPGLFNEKIS
jgi:uncharacterized CHY-type Zn-finger protein